MDCIGIGDEWRPGGACSRLVYRGWGGWAIAHDINDFSQDVDKDATAIDAFVGYNFTENLGAELGYLSTGDWDIAGNDFNSQGPPCR